MQQKAVSESVGVAHYFPDERIRSADLMAELEADKRYGLSHRYLEVLTGISERRWSPRGTPPSDLAAEASKQLLSKSNIAPASIDCIIYCGIERDWQEPATAHRIQDLLGASNATCFDVTNACHGFMNGVSIADALLGQGSVELCLVCTAEIGSLASRAAIEHIGENRLDKKAFRLLMGALTVGDAGAAMLLAKSNGESGFQHFSFHSAGEHSKLCHYGRGADDKLYGEMHMEEICMKTLEFHEQQIDETYESLRWSPDEIDVLISHQVGKKVHRQVCELARIEQQRAPMIVSNYGNLASATIPTVLSLNPPSKGDKVLIISSGSGMTIGQSAMVAS